MSGTDHLEEIWRSAMNIEQLRRVLADLPGDMPVIVEDSMMGWMQNTLIYSAPAHIDRRLSGTYLLAGHLNDAENCYALLISVLSQTDDDLVQITRETMWPQIIDAEAEE
jgi:hypothetical protein